MAAKRGRGRPAKPVIRPPGDIDTKIPKNRYKFVMHRLRWYMETLEAQIKYDVSSVKGKDYIDAVMAYNKAFKEMENEKVKDRVDSGSVGKDSGEKSTPGVGSDRPSSLGPRVSAPNPLA